MPGAGAGAGTGTGAGAGAMSGAGAGAGGQTGSSGAKPVGQVHVHYSQHSNDEREIRSKGSTVTETSWSLTGRLEARA